MSLTVSWLARGSARMIGSGCGRLAVCCRTMPALPQRNIRRSRWTVTFCQSLRLCQADPIVLREEGMPPALHPRKKRTGASQAKWSSTCHWAAAQALPSVFQRHTPRAHLDNFALRAPGVLLRPAVQVAGGTIIRTALFVTSESKNELNSQ
jgi:hypothetical protein